MTELRVGTFGRDEARLRALCEAHGVRLLEGLGPGRFGVEGLSPASRRALLVTALEQGLDLSFLAAQLAGPGWVAFDADSTLIDGEGIDLVAARVGCGQDVARITEAAMRGELDYAQSLRERVARLRGAPASVLHEVAADLRLNPGAAEAVDALRGAGWRTLVVSGGFLPLVESVRARLGLDAAVANRLAVSNGLLTGEVEGDIVGADRKQEALRELASGLPTVAVGDGANDAEMLRAATVGIAFRPKPTLLSAADGVIARGDLSALPFLAGIFDTD